jgi:hypothetical protein
VKDPFPSHVPSSPPLSPLSNLAKSNFSKPILKFDYLLQSKVKSVVEEAIAGGLVMNKAPCMQVGRKYQLSLPQIQALKDIRSGKQSAVLQVLGAGKSWEKSP